MCLFILIFPVRFHLVNKKYVLLGFTLILALFFFMFAIFYDAISPVLDRSLEIFINDGQHVLSSRIYPSKEAKGIVFIPNGNIKTNVDFYEI